MAAHLSKMFCLIYLRVTFVKMKNFQQGRYVLFSKLDHSPADWAVNWRLRMPIFAANSVEPIEQAQIVESVRRKAIHKNDNLVIWLVLLQTDCAFFLLLGRIGTFVSELVQVSLLKTRLNSLNKYEKGLPEQTNDEESDPAK